MERTQELARDANCLAGWLLIMAVACGGCKTPIYYHQVETPIASCHKTCCDRQHTAGDSCAAYCEPSCFGYEPTCWTRWPAEFPSNCPIADDVPVDPPVILHEELIFDRVYKEVPAWELPSNDVDSAPDSPPLPDGHMPAEPFPEDFSVHASLPSILVKDPVRSSDSDNESLPPRRVPLAQESPDRSVMTQSNAPLLTDEHVRIFSNSMVATPNQDVPTVADKPTSSAATKAAEANPQVSSRRRTNRKHRLRVPEIAQTAAIASIEGLSQGMVRTADLEIAPTHNSNTLVSSRRQPANPRTTFSWPETVPIISLTAVPVPAAPAQDPNLLTKVGKSPRFDVQRLPEVENVNAVAPQPTPQARRVSSDGKATIRFAKDKTRTPAGFGAAHRSSSTTVRFR